MQQNDEMLAGLRILVVDDEALIAMLLEDTLADLGCEVIGPVSTVEAALAAVAQDGIDGVLLDANLHGKSALPVAEALLDRGVPFILVTAYGFSDEEAPALHDATRVQKPFNQKELTAAMAAAFVRSKPVM